MRKTALETVLNLSCDDLGLVFEPDANGRKIAQSTHGNEYIKQEKTFCRNVWRALRPWNVCEAWANGWRVSVKRPMGRWPAMCLPFFSLSCSMLWFKSI